MAFGDNGVVKYAESVSDYAANDEAATSGLLNSAVSYIDNITNPETSTTVIDAKGGNLYKDTTAITDEIGNTVYIPGGFKVASDSATKVEDGIVIEDSDGNQFVWVPVLDYTTMYEETDKSIKLSGIDTTTKVYSKLRVRNGDKYLSGTPGEVNKIREPDILSSTVHGDAASNQSDRGIEQIKNVLQVPGNTNDEILKNYSNEIVNEYKSSYISIKKYKGFYVGRYEIGGSIDSPMVKKGQKVLTNQNWYGLKKACNNLVNTKTAQSLMIFGNQWDEIISWIIKTNTKTNEQVNIDSSSWGNYKNGQEEGVKRTSGYNDSWKVNNIYDLAGNCWEWSQEAYDIGARVHFGGCYNNTGTACAAIRNSNGAYASHDDLSTRAVLYIK